MSHLQSKRDEQGRAAAAWEGVLLAEDRRAERPPLPPTMDGRTRGTGQGSQESRTRAERRGGQARRRCPT